MSRRKPLTERQERFCAEYIIDCNAKLAAIRAGFSKNAANRAGYRLLQIPALQDRIATLQKKVADKVEVTATRVIEELAAVAFANMSQYIGAKGIDLSTLSRDQWAAVQEVTFDGKDLAKFKLGDKLQALELLGKHLKLFTDKIEWLGDSSFVKLLEAARARVKK